MGEGLGFRGLGEGLGFRGLGFRGLGFRATESTLYQSKGFIGVLSPTMENQMENTNNGESNGKANQIEMETGTM